MDSFALFELISSLLIGCVLVFDIVWVIKARHVPSIKETTLWIILYIFLACVFALSLYFVYGNFDISLEFIGGYLTEYSLSIDNIFVFLIIMKQFKVKAKYCQELLMIGILIALVFRAVFIFIGVALVENFIFIFYIFASWLLYVAVKQIKGEDENEEIKEGVIAKLLKKVIPISQEYHPKNEAKLCIRKDGKIYFTPVILLLLSLGGVDLLFALDSIPAVFGITNNLFIILSVNIFALMGLRQLYFLIGSLLEKLKYLHIGIAFILAFIAVKLILHALHNNNLSFINGGNGVEWAIEIPVIYSVVVIFCALAASVLFSVVDYKKHNIRK